MQNDQQEEYFRRQTEIDNLKVGDHVEIKVVVRVTEAHSQSEMGKFLVETPHLQKQMWLTDSQIIRKVSF